MTCARGNYSRPCQGEGCGAEAAAPRVRAAAGSYNICSAQAAPDDNGLGWQDEN